MVARFSAMDKEIPNELGGPLAFLRWDDAAAAQIAHLEELPEKHAVYRNPQSPMHPGLQARLEQLGMENLYAHQAACFDAAMQGEDVVLVTGTNSGKTLAYNLPALQMCLSEPMSRALSIFPTKALAQDQLGKLEALVPGPEVRLGVFDGDTPKSQRGPIKKLAHVVLTNPDMLHVGILPGHEQWARFLKALRLIVIDEMHVYRGVFGSHVAGVIRRLLRLCEWHRNRPQIIACSATVGNAGEVFEKLTGRTARVIDEDGAPRSRRTFVFWNPPYIGANERLSANIVCAELVAGLVEEDKRVLAFNRARITTEIVLRHTRRRLKQSGGAVRATQVESYRAGYTVRERREIEKSLFQGDLRGLIATNAMELGVDIGGLDAVVMNGYPGSRASFWQQAGRAGRRTHPGLAILVAHDDPLEQFLIRRPEMVLGTPVESVALSPANPQILAQQLRCAAYERPLAPSEIAGFGSGALDVAEEMDRSGVLEFRRGLFFYPAFESPAGQVDIRGAGGAAIRLFSEGEEIGSMERWRAFQAAHEGAVYLHRGRSYVAQTLDLEHHRAELVPQEVDYYTQTRVQSVLEPKVDLRVRRLGEAAVRLCGLRVTECVLSYLKKSLDGERVLEETPLDLPPSTFETVGLRLDLPPLREGDALESVPLGVHGLEHALMAVAPLFAGCDRRDLGSAWYVAFPGSLGPAVFIFDHTPGGIGLSERLYEGFEAWLDAARTLLESCPCEEGCPACLLSAHCESANEALGKRPALRLLRTLQSGL